MASPSTETGIETRQLNLHIFLQDTYSRVVNLDSLDPQQLSQVKKQIEGELDHLGASFAQLHTAQAKFKECLRCVEARFESSQSMLRIGIPVHRPVTQSLTNIL